MSDAEAWLTLSRIHPWLAMSDIDRSDDPNHGSMMMRYWMVTSGETPKGKKGNNGLLHNPHLQIGEYSFNCENPYQCNDDPDEPMSSMLVMQDVMNRQQKWVASGGGKNLKALPMMVPTLRRHPVEAQIILNAIRKYPKPFIAQMGFPEISANVNQLQEQIRALRLIAGEDGPDPGHQLEKIFGGDLTVRQATKDPSLNLPLEMIYPYTFDKKSGKWVKISAEQLKKVKQGAVAQLNPAQRVQAGLVGLKTTINGIPGQIDAKGNLVSDPATLTPAQRIQAGFAGKPVTIAGLSGHIDPQGAFIADKTSSGPGEQDKTTGYLVLGGAVLATIGAFVALVRQERSPWP
jgi:hypothetical protein